MKCEHRKAPSPPRPLTIVTFNKEEIGDALRGYALRMGQQMPTGVTHWSINGLCSEIQLVIERDEGQEVWPPKDVGDGG